MFHDCLKNHALHYLRGEKKSRKFLLAPQHLNSFFSHSLESQNNFWQQVRVLCDKGCVRLLRWVLASLNQQVIQSCEFLLPTSDRPNSASTSSQLNDIVLVLFSRGSVYKGFAGTWHGGVGSQSVQCYNPVLTPDLLWWMLIHKPSVSDQCVMPV